MSDKPKSVEVGQRWSFRGSDELIVRSVHGPGECKRVTHGDGCAHFDGGSWAPLASFQHGIAVYLGGPTPTPGEGKGMEARPTGAPARCLRCGDTREEGYYMHFACWNKDERESNEWASAWDAGVRDFPRPAPAAEFINCTFDTTPARPAPVGDGVTDDAAYWKKLAQDYVERVEKTLTIQPSKPAPAYGRMVGEMRDASGAPLSALELVTSRSKPEPWIPSVDDFDLLPDV